MVPVGPIPTIYSLYWPETRLVVEAMWRDANHDWYDRAWDRQHERADLEMLDTWKRWSGMDLAGFDHVYSTNGASEAIKDIIALHGQLGVHVFEGEYEGYAAYAAAFGFPVHKHPSSWVPDIHTEGIVWISDPSALDGEHWPFLAEWLREAQKAAPLLKVFLDVIYVGCVKELKLVKPAEHPNVEAVVFSLSKPFGVYRHRVGGAFSRSPLPSLEGNRWFNNVFSLKLATRLMDRYSVTEIPNRYARTQEYAILHLAANGLVPLETVPSNAILLAHSPGTHRGDASGDPFSKFVRVPGRVYRYCLTPEIHALISAAKGPFSFKAMREALEIL